MSVFIFLAPFLLLSLPGCLGARGDIELVEARLRQQQDLADRYARDLLTAERERDAARHEADLLRKQIADAGQSPLTSELASGLFQVQGIEFNSLMTGGRDRDGRPGDDVLIAVFVPRDEHGDVVKLPGDIQLEALDLNRPEGERQVGKWTYSAADGRKLWKSGAFSSGYQIEVPLQGADSEKLVLHARLSTADGRSFDATHTVKLKTSGVASRGPATGKPPVAPPAEAESPGRANVVSALHEQSAPDAGKRIPRPTIEPVSNQSITPAPFPNMPDPTTDSPAPKSPPNPFDDIQPASSTQSGASQDATVKKPAELDPSLPGDGTQDAQPLPFPEGLRTSDVFTDATIPYYR